MFWLSLFSQDPLNPQETVIVIRSLVPAGVAEKDGRLIPGDRLISVNGINLENASLDQAVGALKGAPKGPVQIAVAKPISVLESPGKVSSTHLGGTGQLSKATYFSASASDFGSYRTGELEVAAGGFGEDFSNAEYQNISYQNISHHQFDENAARHYDEHSSRF